MSSRFAAARGALEALCSILARELIEELGPELARSPRHLMLPKRIHELAFHEPVAPDGLSAEYVERAAALNRTSRRLDGGSATLLLLRSVQEELDRAAVNERRLIAFLNGGGT